MRITFQRPQVAPPINCADSTWVTSYPFICQVRVYAWILAGDPDYIGLDTPCWFPHGYVDLPENTTWIQFVRNATGWSAEQATAYEVTAFVSIPYLRDMERRYELKQLNSRKVVFECPTTSENNYVE